MLSEDEFYVKRVLAIILGGGAGTRLYPLTKLRAKPAVPLAGKYRLIDIPISNCINSEIQRIYVLTQFNSASLNRHIAQTYRLDVFSGGYVEVIAAERERGTPLPSALDCQPPRFERCDAGSAAASAGRHDRAG